MNHNRPRLVPRVAGCPPGVFHRTDGDPGALACPARFGPESDATHNRLERR